MNRSDYKRLGNYIREVDVRNRDFAVTQLVGLSIDKAFIPSVANVIGTDLSNYKVIRNKQFACSLMQVSRDQKIPVAIFKGTAAIMSPAYPMFEVIDEQELMPEYLMMWFARKEFDREASFYAVGGVRGSLTWDDFTNMTLPVPSIERQRAMVAEYETLSRRIGLNRSMIAQLEATAQTLYRKMFVDDIDPEHLPAGWRMGTLDTLCELIIAGIIPLYSEKSDYLVLGQKCNYDGGIDLSKARLHIPKKNCIWLKFGDILVNSTGAGTLGRVGQIYFQPKDITFDSNMTLVRAKEDNLIEYLGSYMSGKEDLFVSISQGSTSQTRLYCSMLRPLEIIIPDDNALKMYSKCCRPIKLFIEQQKQENSKLGELQSLLLAKMGQ